MRINKRSWMGMLITQYKKVSVENLDAANEVICDALAKLESLNKVKVVRK